MVPRVTIRRRSSDGGRLFGSAAGSLVGVAIAVFAGCGGPSDSLFSGSGSGGGGGGLFGSTSGGGTGGTGGSAPCTAGEKRCAGVTPELCDPSGRWQSGAACPGGCSAGACVSASCNDGQKNGGETDVDCGGPCAAKCSLGQGCGVSTDCGDPSVCGEGQCRFGISCGEIHAQKPGLGTKPYTIDPDVPKGPLQPVDVFCDMAIDGGGWTLVGRTKPGGNPAALNSNGCIGNDDGKNFGWTSSQGSIFDDASPYSLGVASYGLKFTEVLVGEYTSGKIWGAAGYRIKVPPNYVAAYQNSDFPVTATTVLGACSAPEMLTHMGFTAWNGAFHFRNSAQPGWGLYSSGFFLCYDTCQGGNLNAKQGMIFVR